MGCRSGVETAQICYEKLRLVEQQIKVITEDKNALGYLNIEDEKEVSAYVCEKCHRYLKTIRIKDDDNVYAVKWRAIIDYLSSGDIDIAAIQNKYLKETILGTRFNGPNDPNIELYFNKLQNKITEIDCS